MTMSWSCPSPSISAVPSTAALEAAKLFARSNGAVERPLLFQTAALVATPWSAWPVLAIASWSWVRATIRFRSSHMNLFGGLRWQEIEIPQAIGGLNEHGLYLRHGGTPSPQ